MECSIGEVDGIGSKHVLQTIGFAHRAAEVDLNHVVEEFPDMHDTLWRACCARCELDEGGPFSGELDVVSNCCADVEGVHSNAIAVFTAQDHAEGEDFHASGFFRVGSEIFNECFMLWCICDSQRVAFMGEHCEFFEG